MKLIFNLISACGNRLQVFQPDLVAVHGSGRGTGHQIVIQSTLENASRVQMSKSASPVRNPDPELDGRAVVVAPFRHADVVRLARRV